MLRSRYHRRCQMPAAGPIISFILIASLGILMVGCTSGAPPDTEEVEEYSFTAEDVEKFRELVKEQADTATGSAQVLTMTGATEGTALATDNEQVKLFDTIRAVSGETGENTYRVVNEFINVRTAPSLRAEEIAKVYQGELVTLLDFENAAWAKVQFAGGQEGYVAQRYIAKLTSEELLPEEKKAYEGLYYVNFSFLNVRAEPASQSTKLGQLDEDQFVRPISIDEEWARIPFEGSEAYVSSQYLKEFQPNYLIRQQKFDLPILVYDLSQSGILDAFIRHVDALQNEGANIMTVKDFYELLIFQEERDTRLDPTSVILAFTGLSADKFDEALDVLRASGVKATFFIETQNIGVNGLTENRLLTLVAAGHDVQSAGHSNQDLRTLTNAQLDTELKQSKFFLEEYTKDSVVAVAYYKGGVNDRVLEKAREAGYLFGVGSAPFGSFKRSELLKMPSFSISAGMSDEEVLRLIRNES